MRIGDRQITPALPPYVIAELGVNHDGSVERAAELVDAAADAGADAIKLQLFQADRLLSRSAMLALYQRRAGANDPSALLRSLELTVEQMRPLVVRAHRRSLQAILTVFSVELVRDAAVLDWDAYKVASPDIINRPLIIAMMKTGRPLLLSAGAATLDEVQQAVRWVDDHPHVLMQCVSAYPTPDEHAALAGRFSLMEVDPFALGYSDHTTAIDIGAMAVASGACVLEKHLTYDCIATGPDHASSLDPAGFAAYVRLARRAWSMMGPKEKRVLEVEKEVRLISRQSLTASRDLPAGHVLHMKDVTIKRPGTGLSPALLDDVIGRRLVESVDADTPLAEHHLR